MHYIILCICALAAFATVANEAEVDAAGEISIGNVGNDFLTQLQLLDDEIIATRKTLKAAQEHVESLSRLRDASVASHRLKADGVGRRQLSDPVRSGVQIDGWPRTTFGQFFQPVADSNAALCTSPVQLVGLHFFPIQRTLGWRAPAAWSNQTEQQGDPFEPASDGEPGGVVSSFEQEHGFLRIPRPLLVRVYADGCVSVSSGTQSASVGIRLLAATPSQTPLSIRVTASAPADTPVLVAVTSDGILHVWNLTADVYGQRAVGTRAYGYTDPEAGVTTGRGRVARSHAKADKGPHEQSSKQSGDIQHPPLTVEMSHACSFDIASASVDSDAIQGDTISAVHVATTANTLDTGVHVLVGTRLGRVISLNRMCSGLKLMYPLVMPHGRGKNQKGPTGATMDTHALASTQRPVVTAIHTPAVPHPAYFYFSAGSTVHSLAFNRPEYGPVSCTSQWPGQGVLDELQYLHGRAPTLAAAQEGLHIQSLATDFNNPTVTWATTRAGDVLVLSPRHGGHTTCKLIARYRGVSGLLLQLAGLNASDAPVDGALALAPIRGYTLAVSHAGIVAYNSSRLPHEEPLALLMQARSIGGKEAYLDMLRAASAQALVAVIAKSGKRAPGRGTGGKVNVQHNVAMLWGSAFASSHLAQTSGEVPTAAVATNETVVTMYDCTLPTRIVDPLDDLMSRSGGQGALGWLRGPMFVLAIIIAIMVGRSRAQPASEDGSQGGVWGMMSTLYSFLIGTDVESTGKTLLGRRSHRGRQGADHGQFDEEREYERMVQRIFAENQDPATASAFGAGLGPSGSEDAFMSTSARTGGLMFGSMGGRGQGRNRGEEQDDELDDNMQRETENLLRILKGVGRESGGYSLRERASGGLGQTALQHSTGRARAAQAGQNQDSAATRRRMQHVSMYGEDSSDDDGAPMQGSVTASYTHPPASTAVHARTRPPTEVEPVPTLSQTDTGHAEGVYEEPPPSSGSEGEEMVRAEAFASPKQRVAQHGLAPRQKSRDHALEAEDEQEDGDYDGLE